MGISAFFCKKGADHFPGSSESILTNLFLVTVMARHWQCPCFFCSLPEACCRAINCFMTFIFVDFFMTLGMREVKSVLSCRSFG